MFENAKAEKKATDRKDAKAATRAAWKSGRKVTIETVKRGDICTAIVNGRLTKVDVLWVHREARTVEVKNLETNRKTTLSIKLVLEPIDQWKPIVRESEEQAKRSAAKKVHRAVARELWSRMDGIRVDEFARVIEQEDGSVWV